MRNPPRASRLSRFLSRPRFQKTPAAKPPITPHPSTFNPQPSPTPAAKPPVNPQPSALNPQRSSLELLESRIAPATLYVGTASAYTIQNDTAPAGLSAGDTVTWSSAGTVHGAPVPGLTFGTDAFTLIQDAITAASASDTVRVAAGTYTEFATVNKAITLAGAQFGVDARTRTGVPETILAAPGGSLFLTATGAVVDGFTIRDSTDSMLLGAGLGTDSAASGYQIRNNIIRDNLVGLSLHGSIGVQTIVERNLFLDNNRPGPGSGTGIYSDGHLTDAIIRLNRFTGDHSTAAINLTKAAGTLSNTFIRQNDFENGSQVLVLGTSGTNVSANKFSGTTLTDTAIIAGGGNSNLTVTDNLFQNRAGGAIVAADLGFGFGANSGLLIASNRIEQNVALFGAPKTLIRLTGAAGNNTIVGNTLLLSGTPGAATASVHGIAIDGAGSGNFTVQFNYLDGGNTDTFGTGGDDGTGIRLRDDLPVNSQVSIDRNVFLGWAVASENADTHAIRLGHANFPNGITLRTDQLDFNGGPGSITGGVVTILPRTTTPDLLIGLNGAVNVVDYNHDTLAAMNGHTEGALAGIVIGSDSIPQFIALRTDNPLTFTVPLTLNGLSAITIAGSNSLRVEGGLTLLSARPALGVSLITEGAPVSIPAYDVGPQGPGILTVLQSLLIDTTDGGAVPGGANITIGAGIAGDVNAPSLTIHAGTSGAATFGNGAAVNRNIIALGSIEVVAASIDFRSDVTALTTFASGTGDIELQSTSAPLNLALNLTSGLGASPLTSALTLENRLTYSGNLTVGKGNLTLIGGPGDLTISAPLSASYPVSLRATGHLTVNAPISVAGALSLQADGDVYIKNSVATVGAFSLTTTGDRDGNGAGGVQVTTAGQLSSGGALSITGSNLIATAGIFDAISIDFDNTNPQLFATGLLQLSRQAAAPAGAPFVINGRVEALGATVTGPVQSDLVATFVMHGGDLHFNASSTNSLFGGGQFDLTAPGGVITIASYVGHPIQPPSLVVRAANRFTASASIEVSFLSVQSTVLKTELLGAVSTFGGGVGLNSPDLTLGSSLTAEGDITLRADSLALNGPANSIQGTGALSILPSSANRTIGLNAAGDLNLTAAELATFKDGFTSISIGSTLGTGAITVGTATFHDPLTLYRGSSANFPGSIAITGALSTDDPGAGINLRAQSIQLSVAAPAKAISTKSGPISIAGGVTLSADTIIDSSTGGGADITQFPTVTGAHALTLTAGAGKVSLRGRGFVSNLGPEITQVTNLTVSGASIDLAASIKTSGYQSFTGAIALSSKSLESETDSIAFAGPVVVDLAGTVHAAIDLHFTSTLDGAPTTTGTLFANAGRNLTFGGAVGATMPLEALSAVATGELVVAGNVTTTGQLDLSGGPFTLGSSHTAFSGGDVFVVSSSTLALKQITATGALSVMAPEIDFLAGPGSIVGQSIKLQSYDFAQPINVNAPSNSGSNNALDLTATDLAALAHGVTRTIRSDDGGKITIANGTVFADSFVIESPDLDGSIVLSPGRKPLTVTGGASLSLISSATELRVGIQTDHGDLTISEAVLFANTVLDTTKGAGLGAGNISLMGATSAAAKRFSLILNAGAGDLSVAGLVTNITTLKANSAGDTIFTESATVNALVTDALGTTTLAGAITTKTAAGQRFLDSVLIDGAALTSTTGNGQIFFGKSVDGVDAFAFGLTVVTGSKPLVFKAGLGATEPLASLSITAKNSLSNNATTPWHVDGPTTLTVPATKNILLTAPTNDFGPLSLSGLNVTVVEANAIDLAASTVKGTLKLTALGDGGITQSGVVSLKKFQAISAGDVDISNPDNSIRQLGVISAQGRIAIFESKSNLQLTGDITTTLTTPGDNIVLVANPSNTALFNLTATAGVDIDPGGGRFVLYTYKLSASTRLTTLAADTEMGQYPGAPAGAGDVILYVVS